jgi:hypothetical protein
MCRRAMLLAMMLGARIVAFEQYGRGLEGLAQRSTYRARWCARAPRTPTHPGPRAAARIAPGRGWARRSGEVPTRAPERFLMRPLGVVAERLFSFQLVIVAVGRHLRSAPAAWRLARLSAPSAAAVELRRQDSRAGGTVVVIVGATAASKGTTPGCWGLFPRLQRLGSTSGAEGNSTRGGTFP